MSEKERILQKLATLKPELFERYHITSLALFGSTARSEDSQKSDIDLLVEFSNTPDLLHFLELEETLEKMLGRSVDLVPRRKLRPELSVDILNEAIAV